MLKRILTFFTLICGFIYSLSTSAFQVNSCNRLLQLAQKEDRLTIMPQIHAKNYIQKAKRTPKKERKYFLRAERQIAIILTRYNQALYFLRKASLQCSRNIRQQALKDIESVNAKKNEALNLQQDIIGSLYP